MGQGKAGKLGTRGTPPEEYLGSRKGLGCFGGAAKSPLEYRGPVGGDSVARNLVPNFVFLIVSNKLATPSPLCPAEEWIPSRVPWVVQSQGEAATYSSLNQLGRSECHQGGGGRKGFPPLAAYK